MYIDFRGEEMNAWLYPEKRRAEIGEVRWEVYTDVVRPEAIGKDEIDIESDLIHKRWGFSNEAKARKFAMELLDRDDLAFGAVTLQKQVVEWFVREDGIAEWQDVGTSEEVTA